MANLSQIKLPNGTTYDIKDNGALQLTGGQVTGPVTFGDSVSIDEATLGDLVVNGSASFTNNIQANTINGIAVGSSPKFTDTTNTTGSSNLTGGKLYIIGAIQQASSAQTYSNNQIYIDDDNSFHINSALAIKCIGNNYHGVFQPASGFTANRVYTLPNKAGTVALTSDIPTVPSSTGSATTGISIAAHGTGTVIGVQSTTTTASKVTVGSSSTDYGVKSAGSASTWTFEEKTIPNVTSAGTASSWTFEEKTIPNVTAAGSGSASLTFAMDTTDTKKLKITFSHTHTAPTIGTAIKVQSKSGGSNGTAPTLGTAIKVQSKSGGANSTAPTLGSKVPTVSASDVTVPIKNASASTFVTGTTHTVTDNGHTHTI